MHIKNKRRQAIVEKENNIPPIKIFLLIYFSLRQVVDVHHMIRDNFFDNIIFYLFFSPFFGMSQLPFTSKIYYMTILNQSAILSFQLVYTDNSGYLMTKYQHLIRLLGSVSARQPITRMTGQLVARCILDFKLG